MKKFLLAVLIVLAGITLANAQNDTVFYVTDIANYSQSYVIVCSNKYDRALIYAEPNCNGFKWFVNGEVHHENPLIITTIEHVYISYTGGCNIEELSFGLDYSSTNVPATNTRNMWKRQEGPALLEAVGADSVNMYTYFWPHSNEITAIVEVPNGGSYQCYISDQCGTSIRTFNVKDNVEISLATCDLETNLNMVTWQSNPAQAQYIDHVIVKRDGIQVGTANYSDGYFLDAIGSGAASRTYTLVAVATDGTECPIVSYPKETIHMSYTLGMGNNIEMGWNIPTGYDLLGFNICEWHPEGKDGDLTVIDFVGASVTSYTCSENQFNNGYVVVQGVENGKAESRLLSNRSEEGIVGLGEQQNKTFRIYPNPTNGTFTVEGSSDLTVYNTMGQVVATSHAENSVHTISLGAGGVYFIRNDEGVVRKVVIE